MRAAGRASRPLYVGEQVPEQRRRGQRQFSPKGAREELRRVVAVELVAEQMLRGKTRKQGLNVVAKLTSRNFHALEKLWKQNRADAICSAAKALALREPRTDWAERAFQLMRNPRRVLSALHAARGDASRATEATAPAADLLPLRR